MNEDPEYLAALRRTHDHAYECFCSDCKFARSRELPFPSPARALRELSGGQMQDGGS